MSQFKVGPAKFRNGRDCHIMEIMPDGRLAVRRKQTYGNGWAISTKEADGRLYESTREDLAMSFLDVLPNVELEWREYVVCEFSDDSEVHDSTSINLYDGDVHGDELLRYRHAPGHPIQIISGDFVDAREKDDT